MRRAKYFNSCISTGMDVHIRVGTSGFVYRHWRQGVFYPAGLAAKRELEYYAQQFDTVELNNPLYRLPARAIFAGWSALTPPDFDFTVKVPRVITHYKKLLDCQSQLLQFWEHAQGLGEKFRLALFQFPPGWSYDAERLAGFLRIMPGVPPSVFEFRHVSWQRDDVYRLLDGAGASLCAAVHPNLPLPAPVMTGGWVYLRLHAGGGRDGNFTEAELRHWEQWLQKRLAPAAQSQARVYFNNDWQGGVRTTIPPASILCSTPGAKPGGSGAPASRRPRGRTAADRVRHLSRLEPAGRHAYRGR
jgi:uncharacterized protein YecE (DUF72 family)